MPTSARPRRNWRLGFHWRTPAFWLLAGATVIYVLGAIVLPHGQAIDRPALALYIAAALTYHRDRTRTKHVVT